MGWTELLRSDSDFFLKAIMNTLSVLIVVLCIYALAYRYYSAFLAAKVLVLDDTRITPAHAYKDGQNYFPTPKWVLFGQHFAAIAGAGPLVGPTLAAQFEAQARANFARQLVGG